MSKTPKLAIEAEAYNISHETIEFIREVLDLHPRVHTTFLDQNDLADILDLIRGGNYDDYVGIDDITDEIVKLSKDMMSEDIEYILFRSMH